MKPSVSWTRALLGVVRVDGVGMYVVYEPHGTWPEGLAFIGCSTSFWLVPGTIEEIEEC